MVVIVAWFVAVVLGAGIGFGTDAILRSERVKFLVPLGAITALMSFFLLKIGLGATFFALVLSAMLAAVACVTAASIVKPREYSPAMQFIGVTDDGQPVYPVVGYTADGQPIRGDQMSGPLRTGRTNSLAIATLVLSLLFAPLAIPLGHVARAQIRASGEQGDGLALAGLIIAYIWTALAVLAVAAFFGALR